MAEKITNIFRILLKVFVAFVTFCVFLAAIQYWMERMIYASLPLLIASALSYYCVIKDHSEDYWKKKCDDQLMGNLYMMIVYLVTLLVIMFGVVISAHFN